jgi:uncharacterized tellurite resistance protein B-like protein
MLGVKNMMFGLIACVLGVAVIFGAKAGQLNMPWIDYIGYGALGLGGVLFVIGLLHTIVHYSQSNKGLHRADVSAMSLALIRSMIAMSIADGNLDDAELKTIAKIYAQLTGTEIDEDTIRDTAEHMKSEGVSIADEMKNAKTVLDKDLKNKIVKAALYILAADGVMEEGEEAILEEIRAGLGISKAALETTKEKFLTAKGIARGAA